MRETFLYQINVTRECNLRCTHCYIHSDTKRASKTMTPEQFLTVVEQIAEHMRRNESYQLADIHVIGGEPTSLGTAFYQEVLPKAHAILDAMPQRYSFRLVTNLLTEEALAIAHLFEQVSTSYEVGSRFPKPALEARWRDNVRTLFAEGRNVAVTSAITRPVIAYGAARLLEHFLELGIKQAHLGFFVPAGDALEHMELLRPTHAETARFLMDAAKWYLVQRQHIPDLYVNPVDSMLAAIEHGEPIDDIVCPIISGSLDINYDGNLVTCIQAGGAKQPKWLGNLFKIPIHEFVETTPYRREVLKAATPRSVCSTCDEFRLCMSGCGVLHDFWDGEGECPGFKSFIKFMRGAYERGERSFGGRVGQLNALPTHQALRQ